MNGFSVLRVRMAQLPFVHVLYVKPHRSKKHDDGALPCERTLFVANAGIGEAALRTVLSGFGDIERIEMSGAGAQAVTHHGLVQAPHEVASRAPGGDKRGPLHVLRQPSPWSLTAGYAERLKDALTSLLPGK